MTYRLIMPGPIEGADEICVLQWHKGEGEGFSAGDLLVEVETQKIIIEVRASNPGVLRRQLCEPSQWRSFGTTMALVSDTADEPIPEDSADLPVIEAALDVA